MTFKQHLVRRIKQKTNSMYGKFATEENTTCSPDWSLEADDVTQLACVFGVTRLFEAVVAYYNGNDAREFCAAALIHGYLKRYSEAKVALEDCHDVLAKGLYALNKQIEKDAFIVHALNSLMHEVLDENLDLCLVALIFMDLLRCKED